MANQKMEPLELRRLVEGGMKYADIAARFGTSVGGVQQAVERLGLQKKNMSHKKYLPWKIEKEHTHSGPHTNLRALSRIAQGAPVPIVRQNTALRWALKLSDENLDIDYSSEEGFYTKPEGPQSHIKMVLDEVLPKVRNSNA